MVAAVPRRPAGDVALEGAEAVLAIPEPARLCADGETPSGNALAPF